MTRGVVFVHSCPRAVTSHVEWVLGDVLGTQVHLEWTEQMAREALAEPGVAPPASPSVQTPEEILAGDPALPAAAGLARHLTPNRRNGLARIGDAIRQFATAHRDAPPGDAA